MTKIQLEPIEILEDISEINVYQKFVKSQKPIVLRGTANHWKAMEKWTLPYFKEVLGSINVGLFDDGKDTLDRSFKKSQYQMKFGEYLDLIEKEPTQLRIFLFNIFKHLPELKKDFDYPKFWSKNFVKIPFMFFGGQNSKVRIHQDMDMSNVFLTQFHGRKRVVLFDPKYSNLLYRYPFNVHSPVDIDEPDYEKFPGLKYLNGLECILEHGDTLFIPSGFWHHIEYLEGGFALSLRSLSPSIKTRIKGVKNVALATHFDDLMRKSFDKKWFNWKEKRAFRNAEKAIKKQKN